MEGLICWMVRGEDRKPLMREDARAELLAAGWTVEGEDSEATPAEPKRRGRQPKAAE